MQHVVSNLLFFCQMLKFRLFIFYRRHPKVAPKSFMTARELVTNLQGN